MSDQPIDAAYRAQFPRLTRAARSLQTSLHRIFDDDEDAVLVEARAKEPESFLHKAQRATPLGGPTYAVPLTDVQDQIGCRIVVRSPRAVRRVIDRARIDFNAIEDQPRPARIDPTSFGYEAWHVIFLLPQALRRRHRLTVDVFELQVSTPFQFAWAVMEHDLVYKPRTEEPTYDQKRAVHAGAALAYAADQLFEFAERKEHAPSPRATASGPAGERPSTL